MFDTEIPPLEMLIRLLAAAGLSLMLGLERELRGKAAGLRSHMLVGLGSAAFTMVGMGVLFATAAGDPSARIDPTRVVQGIIGGIGFLGAGSIIQSRGQIQGITTGASIWLSGAIGVAAGVGNLVLAGMVTFMALIILAGLGRAEKRGIKETKGSNDQDSRNGDS